MESWLGIGALVATVALNVWYQRSRAKLPPSARKEHDAEMRREAGIW